MESCNGFDSSKSALVVYKVVSMYQFYVYLHKSSSDPESWLDFFSLIGLISENIEPSDIENDYVMEERKLLANGNPFDCFKTKKHAERCLLLYNRVKEIPVCY